MPINNMKAYVNITPTSRGKYILKFRISNIAMIMAYTQSSIKVKRQKY